MILAFHDGTPADVIDGYVGSPMYGIIEEHGLALLAGLLVALLGAFVAWRTRRGAPHPKWLSSYPATSASHRLLLWLVVASSAIHAALALAHGFSVYTVLFALDAGLLGYAASRLARGRRWRRWVRLTLLASVLGYVVFTIAGESPDQVGLATKLVELLALSIAFAPTTETRWRRLGASSAVVALVVAVAFGSWVGAFSTGGGHHLGDTPAPGVLLPAGDDRDPTPAEVSAAADLHAATAAAIARYADPAAAAADGYDVGTIRGRDHHATNAAYENDDFILDPTRPETLVYAEGRSGPVLLGAMFSMPEIGHPGPAVGGPLTVWHAHDHVCFSLTPVAIAGLTSPFGQCPLGSITMPVTNEMIHVWVLPGVPEPFGDIEDEWLDDYLAAVG